ncbi:hypothetical protein ACWEPD_31355 [Streptomyces pseudogriseolus]
MSYGAQSVTRRYPRRWWWALLVGFAAFVYSTTSVAPAFRLTSAVPSWVSQEAALMLTDSPRAVASSRHQRVRCSWSGSSATRPRLGW